MNATAPKLVTTHDAARALNVSRSTVHRLITSGDLPAVRVGAQLRVDLDELGEWLERNRVEGPGA